jgi:hypothetical protein
MDLVPAIEWRPKPFWLPLDLVTIIGWKLKKDEYDKSPSICFVSPKGWTISKNMVAIQLS